MVIQSRSPCYRQKLIAGIILLQIKPSLSDWSARISEIRHDNLTRGGKSCYSTHGRVTLCPQSKSPMWASRTLRESIMIDLWISWVSNIQSAISCADGKCIGIQKLQTTHYIQWVCFYEQQNRISVQNKICKMCTCIKFNAYNDMDMQLLWVNSGKSYLLMLKQLMNDIGCKLNNWNDWFVW